MGSVKVFLSFLKAVSGVRKCIWCLAMFSQIFFYSFRLFFFIPKSNFPCQRWCVPSATGPANKSLHTWTCHSILCVTMMTKEPQRSTVMVVCAWQSFGTVWSPAPNHWFSYSAHCRSFTTLIFIPQFWSDVFTYLFLNSDAQLTAGASLDLEMKLRDLVSPVQPFELISLINTAGEGVSYMCC